MIEDDYFGVPIRKMQKISQPLRAQEKFEGSKQLQYYMVYKGAFPSDHHRVLLEPKGASLVQRLNGRPIFLQ